jgi:hypothetical protein
MNKDGEKAEQGEQGAFTMNGAEIVVHGSVKSDGSLELDEKLQLPAGRVQVTVQPVIEPTAPKENWWDYLQRARAEIEASGAKFRTAEEIEAEHEDFRSGDERIENLYKELESEHYRREQKGC